MLASDSHDAAHIDLHTADWQSYMLPVVLSTRNVLVESSDDKPKGAPQKMKLAVRTHDGLALLRQPKAPVSCFYQFRGRVELWLCFKKLFSGEQCCPLCAAARQSKSQPQLIIARPLAVLALGDNPELLYLSRDSSVAFSRLFLQGEVGQ